MYTSPNTNPPTINAFKTVLRCIARTNTIGYRSVEAQQQKCVGRGFGLRSLIRAMPGPTPLMNFRCLSSVVLFTLLCSGCVHTPPGTSVEVALARKPEIVKMPEPEPLIPTP